jgi:hypothetical protein
MTTSLNESIIFMLQPAGERWKVKNPRLIAPKDVIYLFSILQGNSSGRQRKRKGKERFAATVLC